MPKYVTHNSQPIESKKKKEAHPIWRGIGCLLPVLIPLVSFAVAEILISNRTQYSWLIIPQDIVMYQFKDPLIFVKLVYAAVFTAILALLLAIVTFVLNRFLAPKKRD
jgi:hypothetical protein